MPALNFQKQFAEKVKSGEKRQTIRALRKDGRNPRVGQTLYLYTGMRTKNCKKIGEATCKNIEQVTIETNEAIVGITFLDITQQEKLAKDDGFSSFLDLTAFFREHYGLPFYGLLIKW